MLDAPDDKYQYFYKFRLPGLPSEQNWSDTADMAAWALRALMTDVMSLKEGEGFMIVVSRCGEKGQSGLVLATCQDVGEVIEQTFSGLKDCSDITSYFRITEKNKDIAMLGPVKALGAKRDEQLKAAQRKLPKPKLR